MASGDSLVQFSPLNNEPPTTSYATIDMRNAHPCLDFDASADEEAVFSFVMPQHYDGGGVTVYIHWAASSATSGNVVWQTALERVVNTDMDSDSFASFNSSGALPCDGTSGIVAVGSVAHTSGAQMDSLAAGELGRLKIRRDADDTSATDSMTGDAELVFVEIRET